MVKLTIKLENREYKELKDFCDINNTDIDTLLKAYIRHFRTTVVIEPELSKLNKLFDNEMEKSIKK